MSVMAGVSEVGMDFEAFWREYPRKVGRIKAERCWKKLGILRHQQCMTGLRRWMNSLDWQDIQFIPYPATFLNSRRWEEEPTMPLAPPKPAPDYSAVVEAEAARLRAKFPDLA